MQILLVISSMGIGGEQRAASIITDYLVKQGNHVTVLTFDASQKTKIPFNPSIPILVIDKSKSNIYRLKSIRKEIYQKAYDVIVGFAVIPSVLCALSAIGSNIPVIVCERNDPDVYPKLWKFVRSVAYKFAAGAVFQTNDASQYFSNQYFRNRVVIPNPVRTDIKKYRKAVKDRDPIIVNTSRLTEAKNQIQIIQAFSKISNIYPNYTLDLYGDGVCGEKIRSLINELNLAEKVHLHHAQNNIFSQISNSQIFVLASAHEGYPNSLAEARALGIAPISVNCRIGGPKDMIENGINGILIPLNDEKSMIEAMQYLISNEIERNRISENAMKLADKLCISNIGKQWSDFIQEIIEQNDKKD